LQGDSIFDSLEWAEWVLESDQFRREKAQAAVVNRLTRASVAALLERFESLSNAEQDGSLRLLLQLWRNHDARLFGDAPNRDAWLQLLRALVRTRYPGLPLGGPALQGLLEVDPREAEQFLVEELDLARLPGADAGMVVRHMAVLGTARSLSQLVEMEGFGGEVGDAAREVLERMGVVGRKRLALLGEEWRKTRTAEALRRIYRAYVAELPEGTPVRDVVGVLGEPDRRIGQSIFYEAEGRSLYLEIDNAGGLGGRSLT
jgi:hypothetical protein